MRFDPASLLKLFGDRLAADGSSVADNFARWFGSSLVVDAAGAPLVVFHGTANDVDAFDPMRAGSEKKSDWGQGIYFTPSASTADYYRGEAAKNRDAEAAAMWALMEAMEKRATWGNGSPTYPDGYQELLVRWRARREVAENEAGTVMPVYLAITNPLILPYQSMPDPFAVGRALASGKDGIFVLDGSGGLDEVIAFRPSQVKSAIGNSGLFLTESSALVDRPRAAGHGASPKFDRESAAKVFGDRVAGDGSLVAHNFARWFGDSSIVDKNGAPLLVYHGTQDSFDTFRAPAWFTPNQQTAEMFSHQPKDKFDVEDDLGDARPIVPQVVAVYLAIRNPFLTDDWGITEGKAWEKDWRDAQIAAGYDGVIFSNEDETEYIAFHPAQIKSADGNSGLFDRDSSDITDGHGWGAVEADVIREHERMVG